MSMWRLSLTPQADDSLSRLDSVARKRIIEKLDWLVENAGVVNHDRLSGALSDYYKLRVGDYRVLYRLKTENELIRVEEVGHRSTIYDR